MILQQKTIKMDEQELNKDIVFFAWECVSIVRQNYTTLDLVIPDYKDALALLNVLHSKLFKPRKSEQFMKFYKRLKLKMKLQHEAWIRKISVGTLLFYGILKTLQ